MHGLPHIVHRDVYAVWTSDNFRVDRTILGVATNSRISLEAIKVPVALVQKGVAPVHHEDWAAAWSAVCGQARWR